MASADILRAARARIEDPKNWTQGAFARDKNGNEISAVNQKAVCWCAIGAIKAEDHSDDSDACGYLYDASETLFGITNPAVVNDEKDHGAILAVFDAAIAAAEAEAGR